MLCLSRMAPNLGWSDAILDLMKSSALAFGVMTCGAFGSVLDTDFELNRTRRVVDRWLGMVAITRFYNPSSSDSSTDSANAERELKWS